MGGLGCFRVFWGGFRVCFGCLGCCGVFWGVLGCFCVYDAWGFKGLRLRSVSRDPSMRIVYRDFGPDTSQSFAGFEGLQRSGF